MAGPLLRHRAFDRECEPVVEVRLVESSSRAQHDTQIRLVERGTDTSGTVLPR